MKIDIRPIVAGDQLDEAWQLYEVAFAELNRHTIQRHLMYRYEFDEIAGDPRIQKWLAFDDEGVMVGLATYTNELDAWHLISPEYFKHRWPDEYAAKTIWYCGFVAAPYNRLGVFALMVRRMFRVVEEQHGVISIDYCRANAELAAVVAKKMTQMSGGRCRSTDADAQVYWTYETCGATAVAS